MSHEYKSKIQPIKNILCQLPPFKIIEKRNFILLWYFKNSFLRSLKKLQPKKLNKNSCRRL